MSTAKWIARQDGRGVQSTWNVREHNASHQLVGVFGMGVESEKRARLAASAPDMFEALRDLLYALNGAVAETSEGQHRLANAEAKAREALSKAQVCP